jgi:hypothetical protein
MTQELKNLTNKHCSSCCSCDSEEDELDKKEKQAFSKELTEFLYSEYEALGGRLGA